MDFGVNAGLVDELYARWTADPDAVAPEWRAFFQKGRDRALDEAAVDGAAHPPAPAIQPNGASPAPAPQPAAPPAAPAPAPSDGDVHDQAVAQARVYQLVQAYRARGHLYAHLDPLSPPPPPPAELSIESFGLTPADLGRQFRVPDLAGPEVQTLGEIVDRMRETYCRSIGVEFIHIENVEQRHWLTEQMESTKNRLELRREEELRILTKLVEAEVFEQFLHRSYEAGTKRFSLEGAESLIPLVDLIVEKSAAHGVDEIVVGMAHRGRLNVLANILDKDLRDIFAAFDDSDAMRYFGGGDVKYHLGFSADRRTRFGRDVHLTLAFNPSHLEFVDPVVEGRTRAKQDRFGDRQRRRALPLLVHGDAAFMGQGVVAETLNLANLPGYSTGGTIHVIVNNQIGFTTPPEDSRSTRYASDLCQMLLMPVFHVNGEDPEAVVQVASLAVELRQRFGTDVMIDVYCYRRYGHNEGDEPRYTQPLMYAAIDKKTSIRQQYKERLSARRHVTDASVEEIEERYKKRLASAFQQVRGKAFEPVKYAGAELWAGYYGGADAEVPEVPTAVPEDRLIDLSRRLHTPPEGMDLHPDVIALFRERHERLVAGQPFDWGTAEMLAYASLAFEGTPLRLTGEETARGAFGHRHAVVRDVKTGAAHVPLARLRPGQGRVDVINCPASLAGVLGFEFGYSLDYPEALVIWEAHYGDFLNCAQVIVDQFLASSEDKWRRLSGMVLYLPHGYEGQGPEHSSARVERFLQAAAEDNLQIVHPTTPAQLFHVLRRQVLRRYRKPLVVFTPKQQLKAPLSRLADLASGTFRRVVPDDLPPEGVRRVLLCSGRVYHDLVRARADRGRTDVAVVRLEQLYPLNRELDEALAPYRDGTELCWVQEEPKNHGPWYWLNATLPDALRRRMPLSCVSRAKSASPATGSPASHELEERMLADEAFAAPSPR
jgi:2-oxoglutarate dehydrogenase E1 component